jgi:hypothetical protein
MHTMWLVLHKGVTTVSFASVNALKQSKWLGVMLAVQSCMIHNIFVMSVIIDVDWSRI